jgi:hypothetical protein
MTRFLVHIVSLLCLGILFYDFRCDPVFAEEEDESSGEEGNSGSGEGGEGEDDGKGEKEGEKSSSKPENKEQQKKHIKSVVDYVLGIGPSGAKNKKSSGKSEDIGDQIDKLRKDLDKVSKSIAKHSKKNKKDDDDEDKNEAKEDDDNNNDDDDEKKAKKQSKSKKKSNKRSQKNRKSKSYGIKDYSTCGVYTIKKNRQNALERSCRRYKEWQKSYGKIKKHRQFSRSNADTFNNRSIEYKVKTYGSSSGNETHGESHGHESHESNSTHSSGNKYTVKQQHYSNDHHSSNQSDYFQSKCNSKTGC